MVRLRVTCDADHMISRRIWASTHGRRDGRPHVASLRHEHSVSAPGRTALVTGRRQRHRPRRGRPASPTTAPTCCVLDRDERGAERGRRPTSAASASSPTSPTRARSTPSSSATRRHPGQQRRHPARRPGRGVRPRAVRADPPGDAAGAVPARPRRCCPACTPRGWGRIVHVSSVHGHRASPYKSAYVTAKHGLEGLSKVIALEARRQGRHQQHRLPRLRAHAAGRGPDRRPGAAATASPRTRSSTRCCSPARRSSGSSSRTRSPRSSPSSAVRGTGSITGTSFLMDGGWTAA